MHGQFVWYELTTPDVDAAKKFYPRFTGWGLQPFDNDYTMFTTGGVPVAGLFKLSDEMGQQGVPPNWMLYVEANDVDESAAKAASLGGRVVHGPADIPGAGRFAVVQDPQGATFGIYKSSVSMGGGAFDGTAVVGKFSWHELMTTDHVAALAFYRALFGWEPNGTMDMGGGEMYSMYGKGEKMYGGMFNRTADMAGMHPFWMLYIHVADVGKAVATAVKAGGVVHRPQMDIPGGSIAILGDPQGAGFALHHVNAQPAAAAKTASKPAAKKASKTAAKKASKPAGRKGAKPAAKSAAKSAKKKTAAAKKSASKPAAKKSSKKPAKAATRLRRLRAKAVKPKASKAKAKAKKPNVRAKGRRR